MESQGGKLLSTNEFRQSISVITTKTNAIMPLSLTELVTSIDPQRTVLFFGAGSSIPSGYPSAKDMTKAISEKFNIGDETLDLNEICTLAEQKSSRRELVDHVSELLFNRKPTGEIVQL
ncbi:MAG: hypothetical protein MI862_14600, partial [Desulfobacterales bacterium]|nr:hypothetical protein [Desulfobacterales bacterium]